MDSCSRSSDCNGKSSYTGTRISVHSMQHALFEYRCSCCSRRPSTFNRGSDRSTFHQVLIHSSERLMIQLPRRWIPFPIEPNSSPFISVGYAVDEVNIRQLGVRITIHVPRPLSVPEMRKPLVLTLRARVQRYLSLSSHAFLCS
ncbi:hypothetical protein TNCV_1131821 [Trichonephila clavipes]|nr:hypothetical protein TNCV_1131821 [Trichonephila clavipes]